jgi:hypothetical protein
MFAAFSMCFGIMPMRLSEHDKKFWKRVLPASRLELTDDVTDNGTGVRVVYGHEYTQYLMWCPVPFTATQKRLIREARTLNEQLK